MNRTNESLPHTPTLGAGTGGVHVTRGFRGALEVVRAMA